MEYYKRLRLDRVERKREKLCTVVLIVVVHHSATDNKYTLLLYHLEAEKCEVKKIEK